LFFGKLLRKNKIHDTSVLTNNFKCSKKKKTLKIKLGPVDPDDMLSLRISIKPKFKVSFSNFDNLLGTRYSRPLQDLRAVGIRVWSPHHSINLRICYKFKSWSSLQSQ
jgi:hypothetical protein